PPEVQNPAYGKLSGMPHLFAYPCIAVPLIAVAICERGLEIRSPHKHTNKGGPFQGRLSVSRLIRMTFGLRRYISRYGTGNKQVHRRNSYCCLYLRASCSNSRSNLCGQKVSESRFCAACDKALTMSIWP
ncbi:MAG: hypothetical protein K0Q94_4618, partial [Paenibacillus sp.]|nr:hypothetical protein [Paenibacillus sp.]